MRIPFSAASHGSQKWLQVFVNDFPTQLAEAFGTSRPDMVGRPIKWISPLRDDTYAEYRDGAFLRQLGLGEHTPALKDFWPARGPQWDGLGLGVQQTYYIVEAKAHVNELASTCAATSPRSRQQIGQAFQQTQTWLDSTPQRDWQIDYYQQANRLAHLYFLREIASVDAYLVNIYFVNDYTHIPTTYEAWHKALTAQRQQLGIGNQTYEDFVLDVFVDVDDYTM
jgi:hypothetical protein